MPFPLRALKKPFNSAALSSASTPPVTVGRQWQVACSKNLTPFTTAPPLASSAPNTSRPIRAWLMAPAHMAQGSKVTTKVRPLRR